MQIRPEDCRRRASCQARFSPSHASSSGFFGGTVTSPGNSLASPAYPASAGPYDPGQQHPALSVAERGGLDRVLLPLARDKGPASGAARLGASDLGLGSVEPQFDGLGLGVGEDVGQRPQSYPGPVGHREAACREQRADLPDRRRDG